MNLQIGLRRVQGVARRTTKTAVDAATASSVAHLVADRDLRLSRRRATRDEEHDDNDDEQEYHRRDNDQHNHNHRRTILIIDCLELSIVQ